METDKTGPLIHHRPNRRRQRHFGLVIGDDVPDPDAGLLEPIRQWSRDMCSSDIEQFAHWPIRQQEFDEIVGRSAGDSDIQSPLPTRRSGSGSDAPGCHADNGGSGIQGANGIGRCQDQARTVGDGVNAMRNGLDGDQGRQMDIKGGVRLSDLLSQTLGISQGTRQYDRTVFHADLLLATAFHESGSLRDLETWLMSGMAHVLVIGCADSASLQNVIELRNPDPEQRPQPVNEQLGGVSIIMVEIIGSDRRAHRSGLFASGQPGVNISPDNPPITEFAIPLWGGVDTVFGHGQNRIIAQYYFVRKKDQDVK